MAVEPATVMSPVKVLALLPSTTFPAVTDKAVVAKVLEPLTIPLRVRVPAPALVRTKVEPLMAPPRVRVLAVTVMIRSALRVVAPAPRSRLWVPVKVKLPLRAKGLAAVVIAAPVVLSRVPPLMAKVPAVVPVAAALLRLSVPALRVTFPVKVFAPESVSVPAPALEIPKVAPLMTPPRDKVLLFTVMIRVATKEITPVVCVKFAVPVNVKSLAKVMALVMVRALAASKVPPLGVSVLVPKAPVLPKIKVPRVKIAPPT